MTTQTQNLAAMTHAALRDLAAGLGLAVNPRAPKPALIRQIAAAQSRVPAAAYSSEERPPEDTSAAEAVRAAVGRMAQGRRPKCVGHACRGNTGAAYVVEGRPWIKFCEADARDFERRQADVVDGRWELKQIR